MKTRPFPASYEIEIPAYRSRGKIEYDEHQMLLLADGKPALLTLEHDFPLVTMFCILWRRAATTK